MADVDWWARATSLAALGVSIVALALNRLDRRPKVVVYAHRALDETGGSPFQSAHATAIGPDDPVITPPHPVNLYLIVQCDKETELSKAWFEFGDHVVDVQSAQSSPPVRLLAHQAWHGWIPWRQVPSTVIEQDAPMCGRALLTVTGAKVHKARPTPANLMLGGNVPGPTS